MTHRTPPTIDEMADILPPLVRALTEIVGLMEGLVDVACHATNVQETTADTLADLGETLTEYAHILMQEATERRRTGRGNVPLDGPLAPRGDPSAPRGDPSVPRDSPAAAGEALPAA
ncbi:hypothetical protein DA075_07635 [Methylobacterium currus]|uniref:Uncharacterized protein n=1 Tax=Methylobacterium currus TaxID=2051553 RepID=A0A2R4WGY9_9HYPH|nr:hypothetical protein [Methylobacterium currus]AWB20800.1 hypothetical protein DA075_07635 [Methylobacterium currus]UHC14406.1 hypothetical protein LRS73_17770 [Methylobacterium currus]